MNTARREGVEAPPARVLWRITLPLALPAVLSAALIIFVLAAIGEWPSDLEDDVEPVALGLAFLAGSLAMS